MREIIFRAKEEPYEGWVEGYLVGPKHIGNWVECHPINPETVGQFTGLTDKNGKKIFEGDIVVCKQELSGNWIDYIVEIGFVEMKHGAFGLHRKQGYYRPFKDWLEDYEYEVIGNIHDNPEILDKGGT